MPSVSILSYKNYSFCKLKFYLNFTFSIQLNPSFPKSSNFKQSNSQSSKFLKFLSTFLERKFISSLSFVLLQWHQRNQSRTNPLLPQWLTLSTSFEILTSQQQSKSDQSKVMKRRRPCAILRCCWAYSRFWHLDDSQNLTNPRWWKKEMERQRPHAISCFG